MIYLTGKHYNINIFMFFFLSLLLPNIIFSNNSSPTEKWIVVTTIQYPTKSLKKIASLPGWRLVVVGDKKTPKDWHLDNCDYISVEDQQQMKYEIIKYLPWNHYSRKCIGYLYAIEKGAKVIYETDDDNEVLDEIPLTQFDDLVTLDSSRKAINVYAYFGKPDIWPRGYPLSQVNYSDDYKIVRTANHSKIGVVQGLVNKDPDVDAIYRLTRGSEVYFGNNTPCILTAGKFCPFNTQNTTFDYDAFWGLYIPSTTPFRVCDIWRGYFVQRLLWDLNMSVAFTSPTAIQERNEHDYMKDFAGELELYLYSENLIEFLTAWKLESGSFVDRYQNLIKSMAEHKYFKNEEIKIFQTWLNDLESLGYKFPKVT